MIGKYLLDYKDFTHYIESHITRLDNDMSNRVTKVEYLSTAKEKRKKLKNKMRTALTNFDERIAKLEKVFTE